MNNIGSSLKKLLQYPSAIVGLFVIGVLLAVSIYTVIAIPYPEAVRMWRGGEEVWYQNPKFAPPTWFNLFSAKKYSESFAVTTADGTIQETVTPGSDGMQNYVMTYEFDFPYDVYPQDMLLYIHSSFISKQPFLQWNG